MTRALFDHRSCDLQSQTPETTGNEVGGVSAKHQTRFCISHLAANQTRQIATLPAKSHLIFSVSFQNLLNKNVGIPRSVLGIEVDLTSPNFRMFERNDPTESPQGGLRG